jgi:hypothetical protein
MYVRSARHLLPRIDKTPNRPQASALRVRHDEILNHRLDTIPHHIRNHNKLPGEASVWVKSWIEPSIQVYVTSWTVVEQFSTQIPPTLPCGM